MITFYSANTASISSSVMTSEYSAALMFRLA